MIEKLKNNLWKFVIFISCFLLLIIGLITGITYNDRNTSEYMQETVYDDLPKMNYIDSIIQLRSITPFDKSIFADIEFGDSEDVVNKKLKTYINKFGYSICTDSKRYDIKNISTEYYKNKLHTLTLNLGNTSISKDFEDLWKVYESKYGKTKYNDWNYQDVSIDYREVAVRKKANDLKGYNDRQYYYGEDGKWTEEQIYDMILIYQSKTILNNMHSEDVIECK